MPYQNQLIIMKTLVIAVFFWGLFMPLLSNAQLSKTEKQLVGIVDQNNGEAIELLETLVNINSGTMNFEGVRKVGVRLMTEFQNLGMAVEWVDGSAFGRAGHMVARMEGGSGKKVLMIGHLDTVFELDSPNQVWELVAEDTVKGPGVTDMKGGDVVILQALRALHQKSLLKKMNVVVVMTGDEEYSGEPLSESKKALVEAAKWADVALGFENGDGNPSTANVARRSSSDWKLTVTGKPAHSSQVFKPEVGAGAIYETSRILYQFYEQLSSEKLLTFNPGFIVGGTATTLGAGGNSGTAFGKNNVVSKEVTVQGDIRCISVDQFENTQAKMRQIVSENLPGTGATIVFGDGYPPFSPTDGNYELLEQFSQVSLDLGYDEVKPVNPADAGAADISFTSGYVDMGLDGLGMAGKYVHTVDETGYLYALPLQTKRTVVLLYRLCVK